jgi:hypothetical protein
VEGMRLDGALGAAPGRHVCPRKKRRNKWTKGDGETVGRCKSKLPECYQKHERLPAPGPGPSNLPE